MPATHNGENGKNGKKKPAFQPNKKASFKAVQPRGTHHNARKLPTRQMNRGR